MKHLVIRSEREEKLARAAKLFGGALAIAAGILFIREIPSLLRYARMESM